MSEINPLDLATLCPWCGQPNECVTGLEGSNVPVPGDVALCWECMKPGVFDDRLCLRMPTLGELAYINAQRTVQLARELRHEL